ncbi:MAG: tetratricopeptide repeat protein [Bacteroidales bacterium]|nr:tetratricopeptide repeat protein [Bacteroidales bacterium]MCF8391669.1 tetratricopeptide repeat protein [Bacteroidales bacterium]
MAKKAKQPQADSLEGIEQALTRTEQFIEDNSKPLTYIVGAIVILIILFIGAKRFYFTPLEQEAAGQMFMAEKFFERDSFELALNGYGTYPGFVEISEDYGMTKAANLADYYAGVCYLKLGDYEKAIDYLNKFSTEDILVGSAQYSSIGDAYVELNDMDAALKAYRKAISEYENNFTTPLILKKMALVNEELNENSEANALYKSIKSEYPESEEARDIDKYIARTN